MLRCSFLATLFKFNCHRHPFDTAALVASREMTNTYLAERGEVTLSFLPRMPCSPFSFTQSHNSYFAAFSALV